MASQVQPSLPANPWIVGRVADADPRLRVICLPPAGAGSGAFAGWRAHRPEGVELLPVELPGRGTRVAEALPASVDELADALFDGIVEEFRQPYVLFGHSFGGMLGYELARRVERRGGPLPVATVVAAARAPHIAPAELITDGDDKALLRWLLANDGIPRELFRFPEFVRQVLKDVRADLLLAESYVLAEPVPVATPLHVLGAAGDGVVAEADLRAWSACAGGRYSLTMLPGGHGFPQADPAAVLAALGHLLPVDLRVDR
jgi:surfactin synthase thioesterase subunit